MARKAQAPTPSARVEWVRTERGSVERVQPTTRGSFPRLYVTNEVCSASFNLSKEDCIRLARELLSTHELLADVKKL